MKKILSIFVVVFSMAFVRAHCPLCTIGAGAAAAGAVWLGVSKVVVALFINVNGTLVFKAHQKTIRSFSKNTHNYRSIRTYILPTSSNI